MTGRSPDLSKLVQTYGSGTLKSVSKKDFSEGSGATFLSLDELYGKGELVPKKVASAQSAMRARSASKPRSKPTNSRSNYLTPTDSSAYHSVKSRYNTPVGERLRMLQSKKDSKGYDTKDQEFMNKSGLNEDTLESIFKDSRKTKNVVQIVDKIFRQLDAYTKMHGLRLSDMFTTLDKDREGFLRACPAGIDGAPPHVGAPPPVFYRMQEVSDLLVFTAKEVAIWIQFMERDHRKERHGMGERKETSKAAIKITFNEFSKAFKKYRHRAPKGKRSPRRIISHKKKSSPSPPRPPSTRSTVRGGSKGTPLSSTLRSARKNDIKQQEDAAVQSYKQARLEAFKQNAQRNLKANLTAEKKKRQKLARKLATMTLAAVEAEADKVTSEEVPTSNLVKPIEDTHWLEHEKDVEDEYKGLRHHLHKYGKNMTTGGTGAGLYFGMYSEADADNRLLEEEQDAEHHKTHSTHFKSGEYFKRKYDISARRLSNETEELNATKHAIEDCSREIEAGYEELKIKKSALKNCEYKVKTLKWMLKKVVEEWWKEVDSDDSGPAGASGASKLPTGGMGEDSLALVAQDDEKLGEDTNLNDYIQKKMKCISDTLPRWSQAFKGDGIASADGNGGLGPAHVEDMMRKMQQMLSKYEDTPEGAHLRGEGDYE